MKRMLNDEQIFELQKLLAQVSISSGVVGFDKVHIDDELTISDNGKWNGNGLFLDDLTMLKDNAETPQQLFPLSVANAGKVLAVNSAGTGVEAVEKGTKLYRHQIDIDENNTLFITTTQSSAFTLANLVSGIDADANGIIMIHYFDDATGITYNCSSFSIGVVYDDVNVIPFGSEGATVFDLSEAMETITDLITPL